ncbi:MAG TPA: TonB-dependent receptor [Edaphocola sp.]|nr:TonB-dependent receptor [Edaphocola sp.]
MRYLMIPIFLLITSLSFGEGTGTINGRIIHLADSFFEDVEILIPSLNQSTYADEKGNFSFKNIPFGHYQLYASYFSESFGPIEVDLFQSNSKIIEFSIKLEGNHYTLNDFVVEGKTESELLKNSGIKAEIISLKNMAERSTSLEELVNRVPGIKIRNTGGLGAADNIMVGGFSGNAVKYLYDNIPIDYLGSNYTLSKIPVNNLERIEIYKGVLPTKIGTDALGSAINLMPANSNNTSGSFSYEQGSFATHIGSVNANIKLNKHLFIGTSTFYNYSKNNYFVDHLPFRNPDNGQVNYIKERLFHNGFKQYSTEFYLQGRNLKWADRIEFKGNVYNLEKEIQNDPFSRARPFGGVMRKEYAHFIPSFKYKKYLLNNKLNLNQFLVFSTIHFEMFDTLRNTIYDWKGEKQHTGSSSEMGNMNLKNGYLSNTLQQTSSRTNMSYLINNRFQVEANIVLNQYFRKSNTDLLNPLGTFYTKSISNLSFNALFLDKKLESNSQIKYLYGYLTGQSRPIDYPNQVSVPTKDIINSGFSFAQAFKFNINRENYLRFSYENTYRLPDQEELFGDNNLVLPNYSLKPEQSNNFNLGYVYQSKKLRAESNIYYRNTKELIRLKDINQYQAIYLNLDNVSGFGIELDAHYEPIDNLSMAGNLTWNNYRLYASNDPMLNNKHYEQARIANMPFYFTNLSLSYNFKDLLKMGGNISLFTDYSYVHQYYLDYIERQFEPDGFLGLWGQSKINTNRIIPVQHLLSVGMNYSRPLGKNSIAFSMAVKNVLNYEIYNEFKMESPGRNFRAKLMYTF